MNLMNPESIGLDSRTCPQLENRFIFGKVDFRFLLLPFIVGFIAQQKIMIGGELFIGEFLAIIYLTFRFGYIRVSPDEKKLLQFAFVWALAQLASDIFNETDLLDSVKGVLTPILFLCTILGLVNYFRMNLQRLPSALLGVTISRLLSVILLPGDYAQDNLWKWGLGSGILSLVVIYASFFQRSKVTLTLFVLIMIIFIVSLSFSARSLAGIPLIAFLLYYLVRSGKQVWFSRIFGGRWGRAKLLIAAVPLILVTDILLGMFFSSEFVLSNFSSETAEKYRAQASANYGILLGGRSEILISSRAFFDSPLLGHGSWARDKTGEYLKEYLGLVAEMKNTLEEGGSTLYERGLIPVHSYLMGGFVWAGLFGGLFWIYVLDMTIKNFIRFMPQLPYYYYLGMLGLAWNIFFSPFGASARWGTAVFLSAYLAYLSLLKKGWK